MELKLNRRGPAKARTVQARVTSQEYAAVEAMARANDTSVAEVVRALIADGLRRHTPSGDDFTEEQQSDHKVS